jgi:hypothetical protein
MSPTTHAGNSCPSPLPGQIPLQNNPNPAPINPTIAPTDELYEGGVVVDSHEVETRTHRTRTTLREAEGSQKVVVRGDLVLPLAEPIEIGEVFINFDEDHHAHFLVDARIMEDPKLCDAFMADVFDAFADLLPGGSFDSKQQPEEDFSRVSIFTVDQMKREVQKQGKQPFLLQDHIARNSITLMVGDSGLGKSPFNYELGICIASGLPFLGIQTVQGRVLYLDYEDDINQMILLAETISHKLGLPGPPDTFQFWSPAMSESESDPLKLIRVFRPDLTIIDTISAAYPKAEIQNDSVTDLYNECRETDSAVLFVHHLKKDSSDEDSSFDLDLDRPTTVRDFQCVRGASALYNNAYLRLKLIRARKNDDDWAFIVRGYRRGQGHIPTLSVGRVVNENGEPVGHYRLGGLARLSSRHREVFLELPDRFRWKDLGDLFKGNGSKTAFLSACEGVGLLRSKKDGDYYVKHPDWRTL